MSAKSLCSPAKTLEPQRRLRTQRGAWGETTPVTTWWGPVALTSPVIRSSFVPGGRIRKGESIQDAFHRILRSETGNKIKGIRHIELRHCLRLELHHAA